MMFVDFSTPQFTAYFAQGTDSDTLPQSPARDFFLHSLSPMNFFDGIDNDYRVVIQRELSILAHKLLINKVQFSLEASDWLSVTKIMLSFVVRSLEAKAKGNLPPFV